MEWTKCLLPYSFSTTFTVTPEQPECIQSGCLHQRSSFLIQAATDKSKAYNEEDNFGKSSIFTCHHSPLLHVHTRSSDCGAYVSLLGCLGPPVSGQQQKAATELLLCFGKRAVVWRCVQTKSDERDVIARHTSINWLDPTWIIFWITASIVPFARCNFNSLLILARSEEGGLATFCHSSQPMEVSFLRCMLWRF